MMAIIVQNLKEKGREGVEWTDLAQDKDNDGLL